ncbi:MAG: hypothetical protein AB7K09_07520 [Planctomycetota bacterium]
MLRLPRPDMTPRIRIRSLLLAVATLALLFSGALPIHQPLPAAAQPGDGEGTSWVWWEGESTTDTNFARNTWLAGGRIENSQLLSNDDWLTNDGPRGADEVFAKYTVDVPAGGEWQLWTRKFWKHGPFRWRFGTDKDGEWRECGRDCALADSVELRLHVGANWVHLGAVDLKRGSQPFEIRLLAKQGEGGTACFDAFLLTKRPFVPRGKLKPGARTGDAEPGFFAFEPPYDEFADSASDLRSLNEKTAGEKGPLKTKDGNFVLGSGQPVRFWAVNAGPGIIGLDKSSVEYLARKLAKLGVNMVRVHGGMFDAANPEKVDATRLEQLQWFVHCLKQQGIYTKLSFFFPLWLDVTPRVGIEGYETSQNKTPFALMYFNPRLQELWRGWAKAVLTTPNPYTKLALGEDPAVGIVEIINEDSMLFWTFKQGTVPPAQWSKLEQKFYEWAVKTHGDAGKALAAWGGNGLPRDVIPQGPGQVGALQMLDIWDLTGDGVSKGGLGSRARKSAQLRFMCELQRDYYATTAAWLKKECGLEGLVSCSNWHTADPRVLDPLERWTYTAGDVIDKHGYFGGRHEGDRSSYAVSVGDRFADRSALTMTNGQGGLPVEFNDLLGRPHIISEIGWTNPNRFKAEFPWLCSAYGSLQDADGFFFFALGSAHWDSSPGKFPLNVPTIMAQFPGLALMYRRGDIKVGDTAVHQALKLDELFDFRGQALAESVNLDELRARDTDGRGMVKNPDMQRVDPLAFYVGRVTREIDGKQPASMINLSKYIDRATHTVTSTTGELEWNTDKGVLRINTKTAQGAVGFLKAAGKIELDDITIECGNEYAAVLVIALDDKPISASKQLLIQTMTEETHFGWRVQGDRITALGGYPLNVRKLDATVTLGGANRRLKSVRRLDENGQPVGRPDTLSRNREVKLAPESIYTIVE